MGDQCERLVLSNELSKEKLLEYAHLLNTPIEVLVFGRILLFYSPRLLLSPLEKTELENNHSIEAFGTSEESPHSGFPLIENSHGTFMFNVKDLYLLDHLEELKEMKAIIQKSFEEAKLKGNSPSEIKDESHPTKENSAAADSASRD